MTPPASASASQWVAALKLRLPWCDRHLETRFPTACSNCCAAQSAATTHAALVAAVTAIDGLEASIGQANSSMDWMWLLLGGALVFFMHSGFALLEVGSVSVRNTQNILFKNVVSPTVSAVLFWAFGYSIAYGNGCDDSVSGFMGSSCYWFMADENIVTDTGYDGGWYAGWFFQWAFCATASTIVSGTVAERVVFKVRQSPLSRS